MGKYGRHAQVGMPRWLARAGFMAALFALLRFLIPLGTSLDRRPSAKPRMHKGSESVSAVAIFS
jgi:hypothetical protein